MSDFDAEERPSPTNIERFTDFMSARRRAGAARRTREETPRNIIPLPLKKVSPRVAPAMPAVPLDKIGNDTLRTIGRDVVAEMMRRALARHNAWDGERVTLDELVEWLGGETYDARIELTSRTVGVSVLPIAREAEAEAPEARAP